MDTTFETSRRDFLKASALAGGGLLLSVALPGALRRAEAAAPFAPNAFLRITPDDRITVVVGMAEMGQGVLTSLPMLVAEDLEADWARVRFEQAPADPAYKNPMFGMQATGGSTSVRAHWDLLRTAGATAREMLIGAAAETWKVPREQCRAEKSRIIHRSGKSLSFGQLATAAARQPVPEHVVLKDPAQFKILGKGARRLDTPGKVDGSAKFGLDVRVPHMLTAVLARAPVVGGKLAGFNAERAKAVPGVKHVVEVSSGVAVVADGYWSAKQGRDALELHWDDGANAALSSATIHQQFVEDCGKPGVVARHEGDAGAALAVATGSRVDVTYEVPYLAHACMEPMNCTAWVKPDGIHVWGGVQAPGIIQNVLSQMHGLKPEQVEVVTTMLGGGFGRRFGLDMVIDAAQISKAVGLPVKLVYSREDDTRALFYRPASYVRLQAALGADGQPVAVSMHAACGSTFAAAGFPLKDGLDQTAVEGLKEWPYDTPNLQVEWTRSETPIGVWFWRSVGHSQNIFFAEGLIDELAAAAGKDPYEYRRSLLAHAPRYLGALELAAQKAGWGGPLPAGMGRGIAVGESFGSYVAQVVEASVDKDGQVKLHRVVCATDCGLVANPDIVRRQMESAIVFGLGAALHGRIAIEAGRVQQGNFDTYPVPRIGEVPPVEVHLVPSTEKPGGVGEPGLPPLAPALVNAIYAATGVRLRRLPIDGAALRRA